MVKYTGVDWLTMTSKLETSGKAWWSLFEAYASIVQGEEPPPKDFSNGFYSGKRLSSLSWGCSPELGYIIIASGETANEIWADAYPAAHRVTRVDLCFDLQVDAPMSLANSSYRLVDEANSNLKRKYGLFLNNHGGSTFYVGSRHSQQYGRLYDKGIQSKRADKGLLWRYEVEYKKPLADLVLKSYADMGPQERSVAIVDTVSDWFRERGALVPYDTGNQHIMMVSAEKKITTFDRKMNWLRTQVRPTVKQLVEAGLGKEVVDCLLLPVSDHTKTDTFPTC